MATTEKQKFLSSFGRNRGRSLRPRQQQLVDELLPKISPPSLRGAEGDAAIHLKRWVDELLRSARSDGFARIAIEIGFGGGEHLLAQAAHHPDTLFIGCEPFLNGVAKCLAGIDDQALSNIRILMDDARKLLEVLPAQSVDLFFILFPDPWPKARHNKRRLINHETIAMLHRVHKPNGRLLIATDHVDYSEWILEHLLASPHYHWTAENPDDFRLPPKDWTETKYQRKTTAEGREPVFLECVRV